MFMPSEVVKAIEIYGGLTLEVLRSQPAQPHRESQTTFQAWCHEVDRRGKTDNRELAASCFREAGFFEA